MIDRTHELPVARQVQLLDLSRSPVYYQARPIPESDLQLMRRIDKLHLDHPFAGARMLRDMLKLEKDRNRAQAPQHTDEEDGH